MVWCILHNELPEENFVVLKFLMEFLNEVWSGFYLGIIVWRRSPGSFYLSGKLHTYSSPKPTFCLKWEVSINVGLGERKVGSLSENDPTSRVAEGHELPRGVRGHARPEMFLNEYALRCNLVHFEHNFKKCYSVYTDLVASGWFL